MHAFLFIVAPYYKGSLMFSKWSSATVYKIIQINSVQVGLNMHWNF
jgi:hypothetical protein